MGKYNIISGILVLAVILMIAASTFMAVSYATGVLNAALAFASSDQVGKLQSCGITPPAELYKLRADIPGLLLPAIYVGLPGLMLIIAILMFIAGYFYGKGNEWHSSSESTTTTSSPGKGGYGGGRVEKTQTQRSSRQEGT